MENATIQQRMEADLKQAMRERDVTTREAIRYAIAGLKNAEIENRAPLTDEQATDILRKQAKRLEDSIDQFRAAGRTDLVDKEAGQLTVLQRYLPAEMSDEELNQLIADVIGETGAVGRKDMGKVMPVALARAGDRVTGKRLSQAVGQALAELG